MRSPFFFIIFLCLSHFISYGQNKFDLQILTEGANTSIRGMSIPNDEVIWVSGSNGTVGKSIDGGKRWRWFVIDGYEKTDFRDIEAFDSTTAIAMGVGNPAYILKTTDGGFHWRKVFERNIEGMFLDAMDFKNPQEGICVGDPINMSEINRKLFYIIRTYDGGDTWAEVPLYKMPPAQKGEGIFAASGTNIEFLDNPDFEYAFITGGYISNLYMIGRENKKSKAVTIPILSGKETTGPFSMATDKQKRMYCIGGDYKVPKDYFDNFYFTNDAGEKWKTPTNGPPFGYRSCIRLISNKMMVACGPTGVDFANDAQKEWKKASLEAFNVCQVSKGKLVFLAGDKGKIGKLIY